MASEPLRVKLTQRTVEALKPGQEILHAWDSELKGFGVRVMPSGAKSWIVKFRVRGRSAQAWHTLGKCHLMKAETARSEALAILAEASAGRDPFKPRAGSLTVDDVWKKFQAEHVSRLRPRTQETYAAEYAKFVQPAIGKLPITEVEREAVAALLLPIRPMQSNRVRSLLNVLFKTAEEWGLRPPHSNPVRTIKAHPEKPKERFLSTDEIARLKAALDELDTEAEAEGLGAHQPKYEAIRLLMLTGCRHREILHLRWDQVDFEREQIRFGTEHKTGRKIGQKTLPLLPAAKAILERQPRRLGSPWVFPGEVPGKPFRDIGKGFHKALRRAGLENVEGKENPRVHDLRHSFASVALEAGVPLELIGRLLGHTRMETTQRYAHLSLDLKRKAAEQAMGLLLEKMNGPA